MKNKTIVKIFTIAILFVILASSASMVFAADPLDGVITTVGAGSESTTGGKVNTVANTIIGVIQIVGVAIAVIMLIWLGVKYVSASPNEKADVKKGAMIYVVGAVMILAATGVLGIVKNIVADIKTTAGV